MTQQKTFLWIICLSIIHNIAGNLLWCDRTKDPCLEASSTSMYQEYLRSENCPPKIENNLCDRYLNVKWYKTEGDLLSHCPSLHSCGAEFPLWLNESLPSVSDGILNRTVCKRGFADCCVKTYGIKIKNCTSFMAYCLVPPGGCTERYCFGENGTCEAPPQPNTTSTVETTSDSAIQTRYYNEGKNNDNNSDVLILTVFCVGALGSGSVTIAVVVVMKNKRNNKVMDTQAKKSTNVNIHIPDTNFDSKAERKEKTQC